MTGYSTNSEVRLLRAQNAALRLQLDVPSIKSAEENVTLKMLLEDVHTAMLAAGFSNDELVRRVAEAMK